VECSRVPLESVTSLMDVARLPRQGGGGSTLLPHSGTPRKLCFLRCSRARRRAFDDLSYFFSTNNCIRFNSIQLIMYSPESDITNLPQRDLQYLHNHPCPRTSHRIRINSPEIRRKRSRGKKGRNLHKSNRRGSLYLNAHRQYMSCVQNE